MKKTVCILALMAVAALFAVTTSCTKEQDLSGYMTKEEFQQWQNENGEIVKVKTFNVTIPAINDDFTSSTTYNGLKNDISLNDVVLVYFQTGIGGWILLPFTYGNASYVCANNKGVLTLMKSLTIRSTAEAENFSAKALIIPQTLYSTKCSEGVDHTSFADVASAYGLNAAMAE